MKSITTILATGTLLLAAVVHRGLAADGAPSQGQPETSMSVPDFDTAGYSSYIGDTGVREAAFQDTLEDSQPTAVASPRDRYGKGDGKGQKGLDIGSYGRPDLGVWVSLDYMCAWAKGSSLPPLITTGVPGQDGVLGMPSTQVLFGGTTVGDEMQGGGRINFGAWLDSCERIGVGGKFFALGGDPDRFDGASDITGTPVLARPFFNSDPLVNAQDSLIITRPGVRRGTAPVEADSDFLSAEAYARWLVYRTPRRRLDLLAGYQFARIDDSLSISHRMTQIAGSVAFPAGTQFAFQDLFDARNTYHGGELGLLGEYDLDRVTMSMMAKLGLGNMEQQVSIRGNSSVTDIANVTTNYAGGLLALPNPPSNIGSYTHNSFVFVPEVEIKLSYHMTRNLDLSIGYSLLFFTDVALAADQFDMSRQGTPTVNASQLLGGGAGVPGNPLFSGVRDSTYWVQGLTLGGTLKF
jgi:hypothetical protein